VKAPRRMSLAGRQMVRALVMAWTVTSSCVIGRCSIEASGVRLLPKGNEKLVSAWALLYYSYRSPNSKSVWSNN